MPEFDNFLAAVLATYHELNIARQLSTELENPTPARLKRYCLQLLAERPAMTDEPVLRMFFGPLREGDQLEDAIRRFDIDRFRPLIRFLNGETGDTDEKNIKLLAWLIDFEPRPYERWRENRRAPETESEKGEQPGGGIVVDPPASPSPSRPTNKMKKWAGWVALVASALVAVYLWHRPSEPQCMYWHEDRYLAVDCAQDIAGANAIARDNHLLENFRKITNTDTLTLDHVNRVWYSKIDNVVEFFTAPGMHPVRPDRSLKAATAYIITEYAIQRRDD